MMVTSDLYSNFISCLKNANQILNPFFEVPGNRLIKETVKILKEEGFINDYQVVADGAREKVKVHLKITRDREKAIRNIQRVSKSSLRIYASCGNIPKIKRGIGIAIVSTSKGVMTDKQARKQKIGGEILCNVW
jgi:small subunit ribosomal protein S8